MFYKISKCEKGDLNISNILNHPVSHIPFTRLNTHLSSISVRVLQICAAYTELCQHRLTKCTSISLAIISMQKSLKRFNSSTMVHKSPRIWPVDGRKVTPLSLAQSQMNRLSLIFQSMARLCLLISPIVSVLHVNQS